ncbi:hypothetical protein HK102_002238, partial [Quaeritorhiza haematococci]
MSLFWLSRGKDKGPLEKQDTLNNEHQLPPPSAPPAPREGRRSFSNWHILNRGHNTRVNENNDNTNGTGRHSPGDNSAPSNYGGPSSPYSPMYPPQDLAVVNPPYGNFSNLPTHDFFSAVVKIATCHGNFLVTIGPDTTVSAVLRDLQERVRRRKALVAPSPPSSSAYSPYGSANPDNQTDLEEPFIALMTDDEFLIDDLVPLMTTLSFAFRSTYFPPEIQHHHLMAGHPPRSGPSSSADVKVKEEKHVRLEVENETSFKPNSETDLKGGHGFAAFSLLAVESREDPPKAPPKTRPNWNMKPHPNGTVESASVATARRNVSTSSNRRPRTAPNQNRRTGSHVPPKSMMKPLVFLSYSWANSAEALDSVGGHNHSNGGPKSNNEDDGSISTPPAPQAKGVCDPRSIARFVKEAGYPIWIDHEQMSGGNPLFEDIAKGLLTASCVIACISDEYAKSDNCRMEFLYASKTLKLPIIPVIVGEGTRSWEQSVIGLIIASLLYIDCSDSNVNIDPAIKSSLTELTTTADAPSWPSALEPRLRQIVSTLDRMARTGQCFPLPSKMSPQKDAEQDEQGGGMTSAAMLKRWEQKRQQRKKMTNATGGLGSARPGGEETKNKQKVMLSKRRRKQNSAPQQSKDKVADDKKDDGVEEVKEKVTEEKEESKQKLKKSHVSKAKIVVEDEGKAEYKADEETTEVQDEVSDDEDDDVADDGNSGMTRLPRPLTAAAPLPKPIAPITPPLSPAPSMAGSTPEALAAAPLSPLPTPSRLSAQSASWVAGPRPPFPIASGSSRPVTSASSGSSSTYPQPYP